MTNDVLKREMLFDERVIGKKEIEVYEWWEW